MDNTIPLIANFTPWPMTIDQFEKFQGLTDKPSDGVGWTEYYDFKLKCSVVEITAFVCGERLDHKVAIPFSAESQDHEAWCRLREDAFTYMNDKIAASKTIKEQ